jgi:hypothetical protein
LKSTPFFALILLITFVFACRKDKIDFGKVKEDWNPTLAVPVISSTLGIYHILKNESNEQGPLRINSEDDLITLYFKREIVSFSPEKFFSVPDQKAEKSIKFSLPEIDNFNQRGSLIRTEKTSFEFNASKEVEIDSISLRGGKFSFSVQNGLPCEGNFIIIFPLLKKHGKPLRIEVPLTENRKNYTIETNLSNYALALLEGTNKDKRIEAEFAFELKTSDRQVLNSSHYFDFKFALTDLKFDGAYGYFGRPKVALAKDSVLIDVFKNNFGGYFALTNPKIKFTIDNSFGFPIQIRLSELTRRSALTFRETPIMLNTFPNPFEIKAPGILEVGQSKQSVLEINRNNSNLDSLITPTPQYFVYGIEATGNADHSPSRSNRNFIKYNSNFTLTTEIELPLEGFAYGFSFLDTVPFSINQAKPNEIDSLVFRMNIENRFPLDLRFQMYFLDENKNLLDSALQGTNPYILRAGIIDSEGRVYKPGISLNYITLGYTNAIKIGRAKYAVIKASTNTYKASAQNPGNKVVKFYADYNLHLKAGLKVYTKAGEVL